MKKRLLTTIILLGLMACEDIIEVVDISKETVTVLAPTNQSVIGTTDVTFTWQHDIEDAENYHLQVATPTFGNASQIVVDTLMPIIDTLTTKTSFTKTLEAKDYEWRIRAENANYRTTYTTIGFRVEE